LGDSTEMPLLKRPWAEGEVAEKVRWWRGEAVGGGGGGPSGVPGWLEWQSRCGAEGGGWVTDSGL